MEQYSPMARLVAEKPTQWMEDRPGKHEALSQELYRFYMMSLKRENNVNSEHMFLIYKSTNKMAMIC